MRMFILELMKCRARFICLFFFISNIFGKDYFFVLLIAIYIIIFFKLLN